MSVAVVDFETGTVDALGQATASVEYYRPDFRVLSCSVSYADRAAADFVIGEEETRQLLAKVVAEGYRLWAFNVSFEMGVARCRFPELGLEWAGDVQRLVQVYDNGARDVEVEETLLPNEYDDEDEDEKPVEVAPKKKTTGFSLGAAVHRLLDAKFHDHKEPAHEWIRANVPGARKGKEALHLAALPTEILRQYNVADTDNTLRLYHELTQRFAEMGYDWTFDHELYMSSVGYLVDAKIRGVWVDTAHANRSAEAIDKEMDDISQSFLDKFAVEIAAIQDDVNGKRLALFKTDRGRANFKPLEFNVGSNKQLKTLFVDTLRMEAKFATAKGAPSFKAAHLGQWGDGGLILQKRRKRLLVKKQCGKLVEKAGFDGRWHIDLRACGTSTGRFSGGGGLNVQGLARKDPGLMGAIHADDGRTFVSVDLSAGEPTVTTHFSGDEKYRYACFDGVGKAPFYDRDVLMIDDLYLMCMSVSPIGRDKLKEAFRNGRWDGRTFAEQWLVDPEVVKKSLKADRQLHKIFALAIGYGAGAAKLVKTAFDNGYDVPHTDAKAFHRTYWKLFPDVKAFSQELSRQVEADGWIVNPFGYRLVPKAHKGFNAFIQSSVSGILHAFTALVMARCQDYARFVVCIHDEDIFEVPDDRLEEFRGVVKEATQELNSMLGWSVAIRTGFAPGKTFYEAK